MKVSFLSVFQRYFIRGMEKRLRKVSSYKLLVSLPREIPLWGNSDFSELFHRAGIKKMGNKLFVGSLSWNTTEEMLKEAFEKAGTVEEAVIILHREGPREGQSKGFGFVTMGSDEEASKVNWEAVEQHYTA